MGSSNVATLSVRLTANLAQFTGAMKRARGALSGVSKGFSLLGAATMPLRLIGGLLSSVAGGLLRIGQIAAGIVLAAVFQKAMQAIQNFARAISKGVERMQTLRIQIGTLTSRELSKSINASIEQAIVWRGMTKDGEMLSFNIAKLRESVAGYEDVLRTADPALGALLDTQEKYGRVVSDNVGVWISTADAFEAAIPLTKQMMNELGTIAIISPFTVDATNNMFRMASAMGFTGKQALNITKGMLNVSAGLGLTNEQAQRLVLNFSQIRSQGKLTQRDIREMTLTGFQMADMFDEMNRKLGLNIQTNKDFNDALDAGKFTWAEFTSSFESLADRQFGESARRMAVTIQGIKSSISDIVTISADRILGPTADAFGSIFDNILKGFDDLVKSGVLDRVGAKVKTAVDAWIKEFQGFKIRLDRTGLISALHSLSFAKGLPPVLAETIRGLGEALGTIKGIDQIVDLVDAIRGGSFDFEAREMLPAGTQTTKLTDIPVEDILPHGSALVGPTNKILEVWDRLREWWDDKGPFISGAIQTFSILIGSVMAAAATALAGPLGELFEAFKELVDGIDWVPFGAALAMVGGIILSLIMTIIGIVGGIIQAATSIVRTITEMGQAFTNFFHAIGMILSGNIGEGLEQLFGSLLQFVGSFFTGIAEAVLGFVLGLAETFLVMLGGVLEGLGAAVPDWITAGAAVIEGFWTGVQDFFKTMVTRIPGVISTFLEQFKEQFGISSPSTIMKEIGVHAMQGFWNGLKEVMSRILTWVGEKIGAIIAKFKEALSLGSPSKVMIEIGKNTGEGFRIGLGDELDEASNDIRNSLLNSVIGDMPKVATELMASIDAVGGEREPLNTAAALSQADEAIKNRQLDAEKETRTALVDKLDALLIAITAGGTSSDKAQAMAEALQTADL